VVKVELHAHTDQDPADRISHSTARLIDHAASLGYGALAVTLHDVYFDPAPHAAYARERGVVLMAGIERTIERRHLLLINFPPECASVRSFEEVADLRRTTGGLVVAPHPFYPTASALGGLLDRIRDSVDAIEVNAMHTRLVDFNRRAREWAHANQKPLVGNTDLHLLSQMGTTYTLVDAPPDAAAICDAIRRGRTQVLSTPLTNLQAGAIFAGMLFGGALGRLRALTGAHTRM
jgi:predicted metal-dependent phosphoesterase TrpH